MGGKKRVTLAVCAGALLGAAGAHATTVTLGAHEFPDASGSYSCNVLGPCSSGFTIAQLSSPGLVDVAPASGLITSWRIRGSGSPRLHVLKPVGEGEWAGDGATGVPADQSGGPNAAHLPIHAGDLIGVDLPETGGLVRFIKAAGSGSEVIKFTPIVEEGVGQYEEFEGGVNDVLLVGAEVVLAPLVSSISPTSGTGAGTVKIFGQYLDGATGVSFGAASAASFTVDSANEITAVAPASGPSTVDVRVTGPGGSSEAVPADRYTFVASAVTPGTGSPSSLLAAVPGAGVAKPAVSGFGQSASRWRRGKGLPHIAASGAPVGTTFSFTLNEPASVSFAFTQRRSGRRVRGRCVAVTPGNAGKARCKRTVKAGSFNLPGHQGLNKAGFQGRLTSAKALKPGTYAVSIVASDAHGLRAVSPSLGFTILAG